MLSKRQTRVTRFGQSQVFCVFISLLRSESHRVGLYQLITSLNLRLSLWQDSIIILIEGLCFYVYPKSVLKREAVDFMRLIFNFLCTPVHEPSLLSIVWLKMLWHWANSALWNVSKWQAASTGGQPTTRTWRTARMEETSPVGEIGSIYGEYPKINPSVLPYQALYK